MTAPGIVDHDDIELRSPRTSLVGRGAELDAIGTALRESRLVTVTGLGGTGKTRLALQATDRAARTRRDGASVVGLGSLASGEDVSSALLATLDPSGTSARGREPMARVLAALKGRDTLLVLDNCEHVLAEVAEVVDRLLESCPELTVLATSREPLRISGESVVTVGPLPVEGGTGRDPSPAVRLFAERAQAVRHDFVLDETNLEDVIAICRLADGIPLAIELAAAHVGHLSTAEIGQRLEEHPESVAARDRGAVPRQRSLPATLDWSYALLDDAEQMALRRLAAFVGGAPADAVAAVCDLAHDAARDLIAGLVEKNLVLAAERDGVSHYRLLDTVRRYALEQLEASEELATVRRRQARWLVDRATERGDSGQTWPAPDSDVVADVVATLEWCVETGDTSLAFALASASWRMWELTGRHSEGRRILADLLAATDEKPDLTKAQVRMAAAQIAFVTGDLPAARQDYERALDDLRTLGGEDELATAMNSLAMVHLYEGDHTTARELAGGALETFRRLGDGGGAAFAHTSLGMIEAQARRAEGAEWHFLEAVQAFRRLGLRREAASVLDNLGNLAADLGDPGRAHRFYEGALQLQQQVGDLRGAALSLNNLCLVAQQRGSLDHAWEYAESARELFRRTGDATGEAATVNNLANLAYERGQVAHAMELYGECIRAFRQLGHARRLATALRNLAELAGGVEERHIAWSCLTDAASLWNHLGEPDSVSEAAAELRDLAAAWGAAEDPQLARVAGGDERDPAVIAHALEAIRWLPIPEPAKVDRPRADTTLTPREQQVVGLVGRGLSNAEIATELFISERTVESHVSSARTKLGIDSRTKLTRWAVEHELSV